ncbi:hypothetical protein K469DRAFT_759479 [Zopfia rhizophila CBS 207.26]|uniref:Tat pathway signal sequence n=1 Tax=Zopfia rhizophila CBS 207.26 TaxID=1314779 RepID=A0A6A6EFJ5_9PEZI|nr:hypothetical protein K469DRAFT_759479 [Zopfia rhizophila CBS 207.26]
MGHEERALLQKDPLEEGFEVEDCEGAWRIWRFSNNREKLVLLQKRPFFTVYLIFIHLVCLVLLGTVVCNTIYPSFFGVEDAFDRQLPHLVPKNYELRKEYSSDHAHNKYTGLPNENNTKAWDDLVKRVILIQPRKIAVETNYTAVRLAEGGGYLAGLGVWHDIHCLRRIRLYLHANYYYQPLTEKNLEYLREHLGHCIEGLRQTVMCNADTSIYTFTWENATDRRPNPQSNQYRKCINWDTVWNWVDERHIPLNPWLLRPTGVADKIMMRGLLTPTKGEKPVLKNRNPSLDAVWAD